MIYFENNNENKCNIKLVVISHFGFIRSKFCQQKFIANSQVPSFKEDGGSGLRRENILLRELVIIGHVSLVWRVIKIVCRLLCVWNFHQ